MYGCFLRIYAIELRNSSPMFFNQLSMNIKWNQFTKNEILVFWNSNLVYLIKISYQFNVNYVGQTMPIVFYIMENSLNGTIGIL